MVEADSVGTASSEGLGYATKIMRCVGTESNVTQCTYTNVVNCGAVATVTCINPSKLCHIYSRNNWVKGQFKRYVTLPRGRGKQSVTTPSLLY